MSTFSSFLKERRKAAGLTQEELAFKAGVGLRFVRDLEQGKKTLRLDKVNQVMKEEKSNKTKLVIFRLTPKEYATLEAKRSRTTCRKLSEFLRLLIFNRPVTVIERNGSQDQMIGELSELREELNRLGNNFNQATKRLNAVNQISEFRSWIASYEAEKTFLFLILDKIKSQTDKLADRWLQ